MTDPHADTEAWLTSFRWAEVTPWCALCSSVGQANTGLDLRPAYSAPPLPSLALQPRAFPREHSRNKSHAGNTGLGTAFRELSLRWRVTVEDPSSRCLDGIREGDPWQTSRQRSSCDWWQVVHCPASRPVMAKGATSEKGVQLNVEGNVALAIQLAFEKTWRNWEF